MSQSLYVLGLANGLYRKVHPTVDSVAILDHATALKAKAGNLGSYIEPYNPFDIYPTTFAD